ncbi:hypothetical protein QR680_009490 [Steinernema hermaphroditum]|uniref:LIM zinc-binding domain-containing protein n=1 Tax=Steinernema hermaphroditum TaxID=289476 RepID=A0AA39M9T0_9BILA|nr:hypothetical protein QR680_009490 [Steinernema hermaphroditum]
MTDLVDLETHSYLRELDSFGRPPPQQRILEREPMVTREFTQKLHNINITHQKKVSASSAMVPSSPPTNSLTKLGERRQMTRDEIDDLRNMVLKATRPKNPWMSSQGHSPEESRRYARQMSSSGDLQTPLNVSTTSSASKASLSPVSPLSNTGTTSSLTSNSSGRLPTPNGVFHARLTQVNDDDGSGGRPTSPLKTSKTYYHSSALVGRSPRAESPSSKITTKANGTTSIQFPSSDKPSNSGTRWRIRTVDEAPEAPPPTEALRKVIGTCCECQKAVFDDNSVTYALDSIFHDLCFVCSLCGRTLRGRKFYRVKDKNYCQEDYEYVGMHENAEKCEECGHPILDMVLQALGKSFHPSCFRCKQCRTKLDGIPFALDDEGNVFCMDDYQKKTLPRCAACLHSILPHAESGKVVRVVALNKEFHIACYVCEGCGVQLTNEVGGRCYPLNEHLLCRNCHVHWERTGGDRNPITDL